MSISEKLTTIAENQEKVYQAGQQAEYDRFWDEYQSNGERTNYRGAFMGAGWGNTTLLPKYGAAPTIGYMMFGYGSFKGDLDDVFVNRGLTLDFSQCTNFSYMFTSTSVSTIGTIDMRAATECSSVFYSGLLKTIRNFIPPDLVMNASCFYGLENVTVGGEISKSINLQQCKNLTYDSLYSIITHLKSFKKVTVNEWGDVEESYTDDAYTQTITLSAESKALLDAKDDETGGCSIEAMCWTDFITLQGWNYA